MGQVPRSQRPARKSALLRSLDASYAGHFRAGRFVFVVLSPELGGAGSEWSECGMTENNLKTAMPQDIAPAVATNGTGKPVTAVVGETAPRPAAKAGAVPALENDLFRTEKVGGLVMAARNALRKGQKEEARTKLQQAFALAPNDCGAIEVLGDMYLEAAEQEKAIKVFERGLQHHPHHRAFEEKLALAHLDLEEMRWDKERQKLVLELGDVDKWMDRKSSVALTLSLLIPGAGQLYNEENERAAAFFAVWFVTFCAWCIPLTTAVKRVTSTHVRHLSDISRGLNDLGGFARFMLLAIVVVWLMSYAWAVYDAMTGAERANQERRRTFGMNM